MKLKYLAFALSGALALSGCNDDSSSGGSNTGPETENLSVKGMGSVGTVLEGNFDIKEGQSSADVSSVRWLISDTKDADYVPISGATEESLLIDQAQLHKYIKFEVSAVGEDGTVGEPSLSEAVGPIDINIVNNPSFDNKGLGWSYDVANIKGSFTYQGENRGRIAIGADHGITQTITIPETAYYDLSAYINSTGANAEFGIKNLFDEVLINRTAAVSNKYKFSKVTTIPLEKGEQVKIFFNGSNDSAVNVDNVKLSKTDKDELPVLNQVIQFAVDQQSGETGINKNDKTIDFFVPYNTDISSLTVSAMSVSQDSTSSVSTGDILDFTDPVSIELIDKDGGTETWTAAVTVKDKEVAISSSNESLEDSFNWAIDKTKQFVMTGKNGLVNRDENNNDGSGRADYLPSYWAGYYDRTAFYSRDFLHQAAGAKLAGLDNENFSMFEIFAHHSTESRKWYTLWAVNFDGSPHTIDYVHDDYFVREVPAQFEFIEKAYEQFLWTGDRRYIEDEQLWLFYTKVMTDYIYLHDTQTNNGVAEGYGGIFEGSATYNERGEFPIEAGDGIGSQYQAMVAYTAMLEARGETSSAQEWRTKTEEFKTFFNEDWSVADINNPEANYVNIVQKDGVRLNDFGKENSWFMPMKLITEPGPRNDNYLDFISANVGDGIGSTPEAPHNIEAYTYLPETFFPYNRNEEAWKWMEYIISVRELPHERPTQGTNGDYPEISFTLISHTIEGLMGIEPDAANDAVVTASHLPQDISWLEVQYLQIGDQELAVRHDGITRTALTNDSDRPLNWEARFYGDYAQLSVNGSSQPAQQKEVNGVLVSYIEVTVDPSAVLTVEVTN
ncbi:hypothetical protein [Psychromonas ossibalaenae]|uniref:hypothetical protein n=1 Tax=Psychromonas ossibalaenae TaxID=444922 RepID=UPI0003646299|nr:hypothetical protein [Psychromonas ossibalaenae]